MELKTIFWGTSDLSIEVLNSLESLDKNKIINIIAVVTNPDAPFGRKREIRPNQVKVWAIDRGIEVIENKDKDALYNRIEDLNPDMSLVASYGKIISQRLLDIPKYGFLNVHPSMLPKYRGAMPIQMAVFDELQKTGVTIMKLDSGMDTGDIIVQEEASIEEDDNLETLYKKLGAIGVKIMLDNLSDYISGNLILKKQNNGDATYTSIKDAQKLERVDISYGAKKINDAVRAINPFNSPKITLFGIEANLLRTKYIKIDNNEKVGNMYAIKEKGEGRVFLKLQDGDLEIIEIKPNGKNAMSGWQFYNGYKNILK